MKKNILFVSAFLTLITGCSSIPLLPEPYEIRYFKSEAIGKCPRMKLGISHLSSSSLIVDSLFDDWQFDESYLDISLQVIAKDDRDGYLIKKLKRSTWEYIQSSPYNRKEIYFYQVPLATLEKCTISEEAYKEKECKKRIAQKAAAKKAAEKKAKEEAEKKRKIEQQATEKNNEVMKKYGKPYCNPFKVKTDGYNSPYLVGGLFSEKKRNCLFEKKFRISQVTPYGMLVYEIGIACERSYCYDKEYGPYFVIPNEEDKELVDGDYIGGLFEYIGTHSYETILRAPKTVLKFKHISK